MKRHHFLPQTAQGFALLDVLAAIVIAGIAFSVAMQASAIYLRQASDSWQNSIALVFGKSIAAATEAGAEHAVSGLLAPTGALSRFNWQTHTRASQLRNAVEIAWERRGKRVALQVDNWIDPSGWQ